MWKVHDQAVQAIVSDRLSAFSAIEDEDGVLLVLQWYSNPELGLKRPEYVIPLATTKHQVLDDPKSMFRWGLNDPLPAELFDHRSTRQLRRRYGVRKAPDVTFPLEPNVN